MQEIENALLATIIQCGSCNVIAKLTEDDFSSYNNKAIFATIKRLWLEKKPISLALVKKETPQAQISDIVTAIETITADQAEIEELAKALKNAAAMRKLSNLCALIKTELAKTKDAREIKNKIYDALESINIDTGTQKIKDLKTITLETFDWIEKQYNKANEGDLLRTGILDLDYYTGGLYDGEVTIIAARPGVGKTALGLYVALEAARNGRKVLFISREMSEIALGIRLCSIVSGVDTGKIKAGRLTDDDWVTLASVLKKLTNTNLIIDTASRTPAEIKAIAKEMQARQGLDLLVVDYLQLLQPDSKHEIREQEVASISRALKTLALDINKPILVLAQLNRNAENKRPSLGDLRESGSIEADADNVWLLHYPTTKEVDDDKKDLVINCKKKNVRYMEIIIAKHRNGPVGTVDVIFDSRKMRFYGISKEG
jgi:replicative DNA helicase